MTTVKKKLRSVKELSTLDDFLTEEGTREAFQAVAVKEVLAWQIEKAMKTQGLSRKGLAARMGTSRSQISRLLDPKDGNVTLVTLQRAAASYWAGRFGLSWCEGRRCCAVVSKHYPEDRLRTGGASGQTLKGKMEGQHFWRT